MKEKIWMGWHFLQKSKRLGFKDGRLVRKGRWMKAKTCGGNRWEDRTEPVLCTQGMHASRNLLHAALFAPGPDGFLCRVEVRGPFKDYSNKFVGTARRVVAWMPQGIYFKARRDGCDRRALLRLVKEALDRTGRCEPTEMKKSKKKGKK